MRCPMCGERETKVISTRTIKNGSEIRRRRECTQCEERFTTYERVKLDIRVVKKDGTREKFQREKLKNGISRSCEKRPVSEEEIEEIVDKIEVKLREMKGNEIESAKIGELVMKELKDLDKVSYIRFASVYKSFEDASSFEEEVKTLKGS